jgi:hypothetical protein
MRRRFIIHVHREKTNIVDAERDKHQIEQHRAQYCANQHHSNLSRCRDEDEHATRNRRDDDDDYSAYNNINQQKQLKKVKRKKTLIFKIKKQNEKNNLRMFFVKKLIKRLQRVEKIKKNVMTTKRFFNENVN